MDPNDVLDLAFLADKYDMMDGLGSATDTLLLPRGENAKRLMGLTAAAYVLQNAQAFRKLTRALIFTHEDPYLSLLTEKIGPGREIQWLHLVVAGGIIISNTYDGSFVLPPGLTEFTGGLYHRYDPVTATRTASIDNVEVRDLISLGSLDLNSITNMQNISFPKLERVRGTLNIDTTSEYVNISFPALKNASSITIRADYSFWGGFDFTPTYAGRYTNESLTRPNLTSLETVSNDLSIQYCPYCLPPFTEGSAYLHSLKSVGFLHFAGSITGIGLSSLARAGPPGGGDGTSTGSGIRFDLEHMQRLMLLKFPNLTAVNTQLYLHGGISYLSIPELKNTAADIHIDSGAWMDVEMGLESASITEILGVLGRVNLSNLSRVHNLTVSDPDLPCSDIRHGLSDSKTYYLQCYTTPVLTTRAKAAIGIRVVVAVVLVGLAGSLMYKGYLRRKTARKTVMGEGNVDLPNYTTVNGGSATGDMASTGQGQPERPRTPPPPYSTDPT
ncbi:uncharacterized protein BDV14DRAFT_198387 [Aspergillus stella-maris]|uniref:uncharacterized protein n=1 Tax=Aspergillus stella-maris TaxID=1810926 RepID=UPI003CCCFA4C